MVFINNTIRLDGIHPFNDFFYCSCFFSALIPVLKANNIPIETVLVHHLPFFTMFEDRILSIEFRELLSLQKNLKNKGLLVEEAPVAADFSDWIWESLNQGYPLIIFLDCFCLPHREDTYRKVHLEHVMLIYGGNRANQTALVMEHSHHDNLDFQEYEIPFAILNEAHKSFEDKGSHAIPSLLRICNDPFFDNKNHSENAFKEYLNHRKGHLSEMFQGINLLRSFSSAFIQIVKGLPRLELEEYLAHFTYIYKAEKGEIRLLEQMQAQKLTSILNENGKLWLKLCQTLQYCVSKNQCDEKRLKRLRDIFACLILGEETFCQEIQLTALS